MSELTKILYTVGGVILGLYTALMILGFLDISVSSYGSYLAWFVAVGLFYALLPAKNPGRLTASD